MLPEQSLYGACANRRNLGPVDAMIGGAVVIMLVTPLIILIIAAVFTRVWRKCSRRPRDEAPEDRTGRPIPDDLPPTPQTWWAKRAEQRARRHREIWGPGGLAERAGGHDPPLSS